MSMYAWIILLTFLGPLALSFDKKIHFYTYFKPLFLSIFVVALVFILWDEYFTQNGVWGFTEKHLLGFYIGHLPIEEVCFFVVVPFACIFIYEVLKGYFPHVKKAILGKSLAFAMGLSGLLLGAQFIENWYTSSACILAALLTIGIYFVRKERWYADFALTFFVALVPFLVVNGFLTGMATEEPVVWYSADHIMGPRIITIPVEDLFYNYDMLIAVVFLYELGKNRKGKKLNPA